MHVFEARSAGDDTAAAEARSGTGARAAARRRSSRSARAVSSPSASRASLAGHSPERIARALHVDVARTNADAILPTGDMFRRVRLVLFAERADGAIVADAERIVGRT